MQVVRECCYRTWHSASRVSCVNGCCFLQYTWVRLNIIYHTTRQVSRHFDRLARQPPSHGYDIEPNIGIPRIWTAC